MSAESATLAGRAAAEAQMRDRCIITGAAASVWDEDAGTFTPGDPVVVYEGRCKLQTRNVIVNEADAGDREVAVVRWEVHLPVFGSEAVTKGHVVTMTACALDAAVVGQVFTVQGPHFGSAKTARRVPVEAVV